MAFPSSSLVATGGNIYSHIFENPSVGLERAHFWAVSLEFAPIEHNGQSWNCTMASEWLPFTSRDWKELASFSLESVEDIEDLETSFYLVEHDWALLTELAISHAGENLFQIQMAVDVDFHGLSEEDANPEMHVSGKTDVEYTGLIVVPDNFEPRPESIDDIRTIAEQFVDVDNFCKPMVDGNRYILAPNITT